MLALQNFCGCAFDCKSNSGKEAQQLRDAFKKRTQETVKMQLTIATSILG